MTTPYEKQLEEQNEQLKQQLAKSEVDMDDIVIKFIAVSVSAYEKYAKFNRGLPAIDIDEKIRKKVSFFKTLRKNGKINVDAQKILDRVKEAYNKGATP